MFELSNVLIIKKWSQTEYKHIKHEIVNLGTDYMEKLIPPSQDENSPGIMFLILLHG